MPCREKTPATPRRAALARQLLFCCFWSHGQEKEPYLITPWDICRDCAPGWVVAYHAYRCMFSGARLVAASLICRVGQNHIYMCIYGISGREITKYTVCLYSSGQPCWFAVARHVTCSRLVSGAYHILIFVVARHGYLQMEGGAHALRMCRQLEKWIIWWKIWLQDINEIALMHFWLLTHLCSWTFIKDLACYWDNKPSSSFSFFVLSWVGLAWTVYMHHIWLWVRRNLCEKNGHIYRIYIYIYGSGQPYSCAFYLTSPVLAVALQARRSASTPSTS
jgi:hypothetical protein